MLFISHYICRNQLGGFEGSPDDRVATQGLVESIPIAGIATKDIDDGINGNSKAPQIQGFLNFRCQSDHIGQNTIGADLIDGVIGHQLDPAGGEVELFGVDSAVKPIAFGNPFWKEFGMLLNDGIKEGTEGRRGLISFS